MPSNKLPRKQALSGQRRIRPKKGSRRVKKLFLIITEGKNESHYVNYLKGKVGPTVEVLCFNESDNKLSLMEKALARKAEMQNMGEYHENTDETWVLLDRDIDPNNKTEKNLFNQALSLGKRKNIHCGYSNDSFELWLLLHFIYIDTSQTRDILIHKLKNYLGRSYSKNEPNIYKIIVEHDGSREKAVQHARTLLLQQKGVKSADANPSTKVHLLVLKLEKEFTRD